MRLIDADELIYMEFGGIEFVPTEFIKDAPTIDAVPVVHGRWLIDDKGRYKCSVCNESWTHWWASVCAKESMYRWFRYCPKCGAMMDEEEDDGCN